MQMEEEEKKWIDVKIFLFTSLDFEYGIFRGVNFYVEVSVK